MRVFRGVRKISKSDYWLRQVCPSCPHAFNNSAPTARIFMKFDIAVFLQNLSRKFNFVEIWQEWRVLYMKNNIQFSPYLARFFLEWEIFQTDLWIKSRHTLCVQQIFSENGAVYEIMWKNTVEPDRPQMTEWRMRNACWIPKGRDKHSEYVTVIAFPLQQSLHERSSRLRYRYISYLVQYWCR